MDVKDILITKLLCAAIRGKEYTYDVEEPLDWELIFNEALAHQVYTLIYPILNKEKNKNNIDRGLLSTWGNTTFLAGIRMSEELEWIEEVIRLLKASNIQVIALKGIALNSLYPYPELRTMGDADLLIHETDMGRACELLKSLGYIPEKDQHGKHVVLYHTTHLIIELHRELVEYDFLKNREKFNSDVWENLNTVKLLQETVEVLSLEMQIIHICVHMAFHTIYGGFGLRQLCDLVLITERKYNEVDWESVAKKAKFYGLEKFVTAIFAVCYKLFDMQIPEALKKESLQDEVYVEKLISDIFMSGTFGKKDKQRVSANALLNNMEKGNKISNISRIGRMKDILFPSYKMMSIRGRYAYVKKGHIYLPIAWLHRLIYGLQRKDFSWKSKSSIFYDNDITELAQQRNELLQWLGLK